MPVLNARALIDERVAALQKFHADSGEAKAQLDVSGGVDSAVMAGLLVRALGAKNLIPVFTGFRHTSPDALKRARECADAFGFGLHVLELGAWEESLIQAIRDSSITTRAGELLLESKLIRGSIRSTLRAPIGRAFNRLLGGGIRHGTGNECEDRWLRFYQKGGDGEVDTNPIAMLTKGEVYQLARELGVPHSILTATPSPDLQGSKHTDEAEITQFLGSRLEPGAGLDLPAGAHWYSYVDEEGAYKNVGLIERIARCSDWICTDAPEWSNEVYVQCDLFGYGLTVSEIPEAVLDIRDRFFPEFSLEFVQRLLRAARKAESSTRHKANPNLPTLGSRNELIAAQILTDTLPLGA